VGRGEGGAESGRGKKSGERGGAGSGGVRGKGGGGVEEERRKADGWKKSRRAWTRRGGMGDGKRTKSR